MKIRDKEYWEEEKRLNTDPYGACVIRYVERWANLMEVQIAKGKEIKDIADETRFEANTGDITLALYGYAVKILVQCWKYGEELRRWYNLKYQMKDEGIKANRGGTVLNPAVFELNKE